MPKIVEGFIRNFPGGAGIPSINVTILDDVTGNPIPSGGNIKADGSPIATDGSGYFHWESELSPGPIRVRADIVAGSDVRVQSGQERMQSGDVFLSDLQNLPRLFSTGVFKDFLDSLSVTPSNSTLTATLNTGAAVMNGVLWAIDTPRDLTITPNTTLTTRLDYVILRQYVSGSYHGKQDYAVVAGTIAGQLPAINANPDILEFPLGYLTIAQNASIATWTDVRVYAAAKAVDDGALVYAALSADAIAGLQELARDTVGTALTVTAPITKTVNDSGNTITLALAALTSAFLAANSVGASQIIDGSVGTAELANTAVTGAKIADATINTQHIFGGAIGNAQLASSAVTGSKIAAATITADKLAAGVGGGTHNPTVISTHRITSNRTVSGSVTGADTYTVNLVSGVTYDCFGFLFGRASGTAGAGPGSADIGMEMPDGTPGWMLNHIFDNGVDSTLLAFVNYSTSGGTTMNISWRATNVYQQFTISTGLMVSICIPRS